MCRAESASGLPLSGQIRLADLLELTPESLLLLLWHLLVDLHRKRGAIALKMLQIWVIPVGKAG